MGNSYADLFAKGNAFIETDNIHKRCGSKVKGGDVAIYCPKCEKSLKNKEVVFVVNRGELETYNLERHTMVALSWE